MMSQNSSPPPPAGAPFPRTWRPRFVPVLAIAIGVTLVVAGLGMWILMPAEERALFTGLQAWTMVALLAGLLYVLYRFAQMRAVADADGLTIVNVFRRHRLEWAQVVGVNLRRGDPWVYLDVDDGATVAVMGIQSADGHRGHAAARELRAVAADRTLTGGDE